MELRWNIGDIDALLSHALLVALRSAAALTLGIARQMLIIVFHRIVTKVTIYSRILQ